MIHQVGGVNIADRVKSRVKVKDDDFSKIQFQIDLVRTILEVRVPYPNLEYTDTERYIDILTNFLVDHHLYPRNRNSSNGNG